MVQKGWRKLAPTWLYTLVVSLTADNYKSPFRDSSGNLSHGSSPVSWQEASIHQTEQSCTSHQAC